MRFPLPMTTRIAGYVARKRLSGAKKFPMVLMLEPLHACNLTCTGCGRIREYESTIKQKLSIEECLNAVDECGAPVVSICGGEPMIYPGLGELVAKILERKKVIILCTNGMFIRKKLGEFKPSSTFFFNVHLDGMRKNHDIAVEREGVFDSAIDGIKAAKEGGFPGVHQHHDLQGNRHGGDRHALRLSHHARRRRVHHLAGLQLRRRQLQRDLHDPRRHQGEVQGRRSDVSQVPLPFLADLSGVPSRQARDAVHRLGEPDPQHQGLERPLLSDHRHPPRTRTRT